MNHESLQEFRQQTDEIIRNGHEREDHYRQMWMKAEDRAVRWRRIAWLCIGGITGAWAGMIAHVVAKLAQ